MVQLLAPALPDRSTPRPDEDALVNQHLRLVRHIVDRVKMTLPAHLDADDLYGAGLVGLAQAARKFDPAQGSPFAAYASARIRGAVLDELRSMDWMSRSCRGKAKRLAETITQLEQRLGREAQDNEVAAELSLTSEAYAELLDEVRPISHVELDSSFDDDGGESSLHEVVADETQTTACEHLLKKETISLALERLQRMPEMQRKVLGLYYFEDLRLAEIAAIFGVTESRICQIHTQAVLALRTYLRSALAR